MTLILIVPIPEPGMSLSLVRSLISIMQCFVISRVQTSQVFINLIHSHSIPLCFMNYIVVFKHRFLIISSVQSLSRVRLFATPWTAARQASLSITNSRSLLKLMSIGLVMPLSPSPPTLNPSQHQGLFQ